MELIYTYVRNQLLKTLLIVLFMFLIISSFMQVLSQLKFLGKGGYGGYQLLSYVVLLIPRNLYSLFPMIALIAVTFVMGRLMMRQELVAIGSIGVGIVDIMSIIFKTMLQIVLVALIVGEGMAPYLADMAKNHRLASFYRGNALSTSGGLWLHEAGWFVHIGTIVDNEYLTDIDRYKVDKSGKLMRSEHAESARNVGDVWQLRDIQWTNVNVHGTQSGNIKQQTWDTTTNTYYQFKD